MSKHIIKWIPASRFLYGILIAFFCTGSLYAQSTNIRPMVKGRHYKGYIFDSAYARSALISITGGKALCTPSEQDIAAAEHIWKAKMNKRFIRQNHHSGSGLPLKHYIRQYTGAINDQDEKVIIVFFTRNRKQLTRNLSTEIAEVCDGGRDYWTAYINISKGIVHEVNCEGVH